MAHFRFDASQGISAEGCGTPLAVAACNSAAAGMGQGQTVGNGFVAALQAARSNDRSEGRGI